MIVESPTRQRLRAELSDLEADHQSARDAVAVAQSVGDVSENTDVALALAEMVRLRNRINQIKQTLALPDPAEEFPEGVVAPGRLVELRFDDDESETYLFGYPEDRHPEWSTLTTTSPVGTAVQGLSPGQSVEPMAGVRVTVLSVTPYH